LIAERHALERALSETAARLTVVDEALRRATRRSELLVPTSRLPRRWLAGGLMLVAAAAPVLAVGWAVDSATAREPATIVVTEAEDPADTAPAPKPAPPPATRAFVPEHLERLMGAHTAVTPETARLHIRQLDDRAWEIHESFADEVLGAAQVLSRPVRIIPHEEYGRVVGVRLYGIRTGGLAHLLGFQNGDLLRSVNGVDITDPDAALRAYARLREQDAHVFDLTRRGEQRFHVVRIARGR
jgi:general secretion pathway protein C